MVRADLAGAGVIFILDPEADFPDVIVVSAAWGLGETVVSGGWTRRVHGLQAEHEGSSTGPHDRRPDRQQAHQERVGGHRSDLPTPSTTSATSGS
ncbi:PEP/pyruvate-binding domain-containing protein [Streptomyces sp. NPDC059442]|uniref:PEP/pyruvate-binding domain-containing protein n=1 Tax=Streptomyces sp. NPDC059442 TaxID=3346830 RepID=UPI0036B6FBE0